MNYIKLINQFWKLRRSKKVTSIQADLYFFLVQECNSRDWETPFECSNGLICASLEIATSSLQEARVRLDELGLINFYPGQKNKRHPRYEINESTDGSNADNRQNRPHNPGSTPGTASVEPPTQPPVVPPEHSNKPNQTKPNQIDTNVSRHAPVLSDNRPAHAPEYQTVWEFFSQMGKTEQQAIDFFNHYEGLGWMQGISKIVSWRSFANKWVSNPISKREEQKQSTGRKVIVEDFNGVQHTWTEEKWEQYRNNPSASGYEFVRYE